MAVIGVVFPDPFGRVIKNAAQGFITPIVIKGDIPIGKALHAAYDEAMDIHCLS